MLTEAQQGWAEREGRRLVPVPQHVANVQVAGTARLLYRPRTRMTAAWWADLQGRGRGYLRTISGSQVPQIGKPPLRSACKIKGYSMRSQG